MNTVREFYKQSPFYWIWVTITTALCYGFTLTNFTIGIDDEALYNSFWRGGFLAQGRWGHIPLQRIFNSYLFLPFWRNFLALLLIVFGLTFICGLFRKYSNNYFNDKASTIFTCLTISFPFIAHLFIFTVMTIELGFILVFIGFALLCFAKWAIEKKTFRYGILGGISLGYATAFAETAIVFFLIGGFSLLLVAYIFNIDEENISLKLSLLALCKLAGILFTGVIIWFLGGTILQRIFSIDATGYVGGHVWHDTSSLMGYLSSVVRFLVYLPTTRIHSSMSIIDWLLVSVSITIIVIGIIYAFVRKRISFFLVGLGAVLSSYGMHILLGQAHPLYRITITFSILVGFCFALLYILLNNIPWKRFKLKYIMVFLVIWLIFYNSRIMNQVFFLDYQRYQHDIMVMHTIIHDLDGLQNEMPILFVGMIPTHLSGDEVAGNTLYNWDRMNTPRQELHSRRIFRFFEMHGFPIEHPGTVDEERLQYYLIGMENWPKDGYIRQTEYFVIVKLGESFHELSSTLTEQ